MSGLALAASGGTPRYPLSTHWPGLRESRTRVRIPPVPRILHGAKNSRGSCALCKARGPSRNYTGVLGSNPDKAPFRAEEPGSACSQSLSFSMRARISKGIRRSCKEKEERKRKPLDFSFLLLPEGLGASGRGRRPGEGCAGRLITARCCPS